VRRGATRGPRLEKIRWVLVVVPLSSISRTLLQQSRLSLRIIIHRPGVCQWAIDTREVCPTAAKAPQHDVARDTVPTLLDARGDPLQSDLRRVDLQVCNLDPKSSQLPFGKARGVGASTERRLECKARSASDQPVELGEEYSSRSHGGNFWSQSRKSSSDEICVDEVDDIGVLGQKFARERCLAGPVRASDNQTARRQGRYCFSTTTRPCELRNTWYRFPSLHDAM